MLANIGRFIVRLLGYGLIAYMAIIAYGLWQLRTITDVAEYEELLQRWDPAFVAHFPQQIPKDAERIAVSYFPGFMQGGAHLQLSFKSTPANINRALASATARSLLIIDDGKLATPVDDPILRDFPTPPFYSGGTENLAFPPGYTHYVLIATPGTTAGFPWNHGHTAGISVSGGSNEIVYWAESW